MGKKKHHEGHHGGAWKVAYADFVTAMMALFMVLWIVAQDDEILIATSKYFQSPFTSPIDLSSGVMPNNSELFGSLEQDAVATSNQLDVKHLAQMAEEFYKLLNAQDGGEDEQVDIEVTSDGLRLTVYERKEKPLFEDSSGQFTDWGLFVMQNLAWLMDRYEMSVRIDAHAAEMPADQKTATFGPWELSSERANAARRAMEFYALDPEKIERITGFGSSVPRAGLEAQNPRNNRLEISLTLE